MTALLTPTTDVEATQPIWVGRMARRKAAEMCVEPMNRSKYPPETWNARLDKGGGKGVILRALWTRPGIMVRWYHPRRQEVVR